MVQLIVGVDVVKGTEIKMDITNDFSESEEQFTIALYCTKRDVPYNIRIGKYVFDHPMQFLKAMTDDLPDKIEKAGLKVWSNGATSTAKPVQKAQREEPVDPVAALTLTENERVDLRALCLKIAHDEQERDKIPGVYGGLTNVIGRASRLYTYIMKGE